MAESTTRVEERRFRIGIAVSILTVLLTPLFSGLVVSYQLSQEHSFTSAQRQLAQEETLLQEKIRIVSRVTSLMAIVGAARNNSALTFYTIELRWILLSSGSSSDTKSFT